MDLAITAILCLLIGALASWLIQRDERKWLRDELRVAHAQIAHAVMKEGAEIPARFEEPEPMQPLSAELQECVAQWEGAENQVIEEAKIRNLLGQGWGIPAILRQYGVKE